MDETRYKVFLLICLHREKHSLSFSLSLCVYNLVIVRIEWGVGIDAQQFPQVISIGQLYWHCMRAQTVMNTHTIFSAHLSPSLLIAQCNRMIFTSFKICWYFSILFLCVFSLFYHKLHVLCNVSTNSASLNSIRNECLFHIILPFQFNRTYKNGLY